MGPETILKSIKSDWESWPLVLGTFSEWNHDWLLPKVQAHRGYHQNSIPENSMESLLAAKEKGYQMAEIDVQITRDRIPVVFHDFSLRNRYRLNVNVSELEFSDLIRIGTFSKLTDVLATENKPDFLNIEIKSKNFYQFPVEDAVVELIRKHQCADRVMISSFNPWALLRVKFLDRQLTRALLVTDEPEIWNFYYLKRMWTVPLVEPHVLNIRYSMFNSNLISKLKNFNVLTSAWTVNDLDIAKNLVAMGVNSIISDTLQPENLT
ncbi:MAG: glycerophosphodiester phosphodiesterase [Bdellovibrionaceae bacterium]|nr:glycerophosphodiester phosphodiesterase [Pseudobdellovibrionaceae bacterium]